jgi:hypothetical protein
VIDQHLEQEGLSFLTYEIMHGLGHFNPVFYCIFCGLEETSFGLIVRLIFVLFAQLAEFPDCDALLFDTLLPHF